MKKRIFSIVLAVCLIFGSVAMCANAFELPGLRFDENGEFKILHLCDCQDEYPAIETMLEYIDYALKTYEPDLVVLGGDNTTGPAETKKEAIKELVTPFVENEVYFTLVFGNHDREQGVDNDTLLPYYQEFGGKYCLAYDAIPALSGSANHNLPIFASEGNKVAFNLFMFDSGSSLHDENGEWYSYDCVREDQIEWYKGVSKTLEAANGGKVVPAMAFQHIIVAEIYDALFPEVGFSLDPITQHYNDKDYLITCPDTSVLNGFIFEPPCPSGLNFGQYDAMVERGDVLAIYSGHDHVNAFEVEYKGIDIINTPGATYNSYGNDIVRGSRLITINEDDPAAYTTELVTVNDLAIENADFAEASGVTPIAGYFWNFLGDFLLALSKASSFIAGIIY